MTIEERLKYKNVRSQIIKELKKDLIGPPHGENDEISEHPNSAYLTGMLHPMDQVDESNLDSTLSDSNSLVEKKDKNSKFSLAEEEKESDIKPIQKKLKKQSSMGIRFYVKENSKFKIKVLWGEYEVSTKKNEKTGFDDKIWTRKTICEEVQIDISEKSNPKEITDNVFLDIVTKKIENTNNYLVAAFLQNKNNKKGRTLYQVEMRIEGFDDPNLFLSENFAREEDNFSRFDDFIYRNKPIFAKGFGCAVNWKETNQFFASYLTTEFIPEQEIPSMGTELLSTTNKESIPEDILSIKQLSEIKNSDELISRMNIIAELYEKWINELELQDLYNENSKNISQKNIEECKKCLKRIRSGLSLLKDEKVFESFIFMSKAMHMQNSMKAFSKNKTSLDIELRKEHFNWRPFQLAFILVNLKGIVYPESNDRKIVDLLWFPTGGGKTEAYLGIAAFLLGYRRITHRTDSEYNKDGGVTIFLRYTLRLLTTQQRDRLLRMICACEIIRAETKKFGNSEFSVGFWVGGQVTVNSFDDLQVKSYGNSPTISEVKKNYSNLKNQIIECPCCGSSKVNHNFLPNDNLYEKKTGYEIYCDNASCYFSTRVIPVYLIDEDIYRKLPSVIISTVDKFARMPWDEKVSTIFGKVNRFCEKCGYISVGEDHISKHINPIKKVHTINPFYPPELIIQDELHLITGPLGTIYGAYETAVENLCSVQIGKDKILPKYIASTATIKNAEEQIKKIYARSEMQQFPPPGLSIESSFFAQEIPVEDNPFRLYIGICVIGQSVKTVLLRTYAVLLQLTENYKDDPVFASYLDPYRTLVGYYNSIRELGGAVRLLDDDIPKRIRTLVSKYNYVKARYINSSDKEELTSRIASYKIPEVLAKLEKPIGEKELAVVLATNMIAVGMDVDRLGLIVVTGQPKLTAEYIQATSRIGRKYPGLAVTIYNPYRPRDMSHYQNFKAYHSRLYQYVEGTTATPFASRARDKTLHAIAVSLLRQSNPNLAENNDAKNINIKELVDLKNIINSRVAIVEQGNSDLTMKELDIFLNEWIDLSNEENNLFYWKSDKGLAGGKRILRRFSDKSNNNSEKFTMDSMRSIEQTSKLYIKDDWWRV